MQGMATYGFAQLRDYIGDLEKTWKSEQRQVRIALRAGRQAMCLVDCARSPPNGSVISAVD